MSEMGRVNGKAGDRVPFVAGVIVGFQQARTDALRRAAKKAHKEFQRSKPFGSDLRRTLQRGVSLPRRKKPRQGGGSRGFGFLDGGTWMGRDSHHLASLAIARDTFV